MKKHLSVGIIINSILYSHDGNRIFSCTTFGVFFMNDRNTFIQMVLAFLYVHMIFFRNYLMFPAVNHESFIADI